LVPKYSETITILPVMFSMGYLLDLNAPSHH
jgi:hypothetical protein